MFQMGEPVLSRRLTAAEIARYQEQGFLVLRQVLDRQQLTSLRDECMENWNRQSVKLDLVGITCH
ncbi:MAG: hypothetical protein ACI9G1_003304 [Pirellulaceae bacterium]|jgi:hypothetical protein